MNFTSLHHFERSLYLVGQAELIRHLQEAGLVLSAEEANWSLQNPSIPAVPKGLLYLKMRKYKAAKLCLPLLFSCKQLLESI